MHTLHTYPQIWLLVYAYRMPYNGVYMKKNDTRIPPQSIESEQAVLGAIMMRPGSLYDIDDIMTLELFYADKHRVIYEAMLDLNKRGDPIDLLTLTNVLREQKRLEHVGGAAYLTDLVNKVPSTTNVRHYAEIVYKKAMLRGLIEAADDISQIGFDESDQPVDDVLDTAEKRIFSVTQVSKGQKFVSIKQTLKETWKVLRNFKEKVVDFAVFRLGSNNSMHLPQDYKSLILSFSLLDQVWVRPHSHSILPVTQQCEKMSLSAYSHWK
jgi:hypothetical protein